MTPDGGKPKFTVNPPAIFLVACADRSIVPSRSDEEELLALHRAALKEHLDNGFESLLMNQDARFLISSSGKLSIPGTRDRSVARSESPETMRLAAYRCRTEPSVKVAANGRLGWVVAQLEAWGTAVRPTGKRQPAAFILVWIELYEQRGSRWIPVGSGQSGYSDVIARARQGHAASQS